MTDKYVIFKTEDFEALGEIGDVLRVKAIEGFVLRPQDIFGPAALWSYAHLLQTATELGLMRPDTFAESELERLDEASHEIAALAEQWQRRGENRKVPD